MTDAAPGLPADRLPRDGTRSLQTSITHSGASLWSTLVAAKLGGRSHGAAVAQLQQTVRTLEPRDRHQPSGQCFTWYDHTPGQGLTVWPPAGAPRTAILSSGDPGWLATALHLVRHSVSALAARAGARCDAMDCGCYSRPEGNRLLLHDAPRTGAAPRCDATIGSESRSASSLGIATGELPPP